VLDQVGPDEPPAPLTERQPRVGSRG
jgi:hypothetical protein